MPRRSSLLLVHVLFVLLPLAGALHAGPLEGFAETTRSRIEALLTDPTLQSGRRIVVTDFDGTLIGQRPNYAGNEFFIHLVERGKVANAPLPDVPGVSPEKNAVENFLVLRKADHHLAYAWRTKALAGIPVDELRREADIFLMRHYRRKIFEPMRRLIRRFEKAGWEVWVVTATTEWIVDRFIEREYGVPANRVIGVRTVVRHGRIGDEMAGPVTDEEGKVVAIDTFIKERPLVVLGNSMGDVAMMKIARKASLVVNPEPQLQTLAKEHGWLVEWMDDAVLPDAPHLYRRHGSWATRDSQADARAARGR